MRSACGWCKRALNRQRPERTRMSDRQAQIRPTRVQSSGERHKRPGPAKSPPTRDAPDERNGLATCSPSVPRKTAQTATPLATNIPSVAPVTNPIAQHHHLGISFHHAIRGSLARFNSCITTRLCDLSRHRNLIYAQGPSHKGGTAFNSPGCPGRLADKICAARSFCEV
jgi:hypothetical protein